MAILSKACKPDNFESQNSLKLSFVNIWDLCSIFIECKSFLESNSPDILAQCESSKLGCLSWFWQFLYEGLFSFNLKGFHYFCAWSCSICEWRTSFCTWLLLENSANSDLYFWLALQAFQWIFCKETFSKLAQTIIACPKVSGWAV